MRSSKSTMIGLMTAVLACFALSACDMAAPSATQVEARRQDQLTMQAVEQVGMPAIVNFQEKRVLKQILELRDTKISTVTYLIDLKAGLHKICDSIGYGIPYATQYTNPERIAKRGETRYSDDITLPQADPNGLYSPASADGTWVLCLDPVSKSVSPVYIEPRIVVSPFPLQ